VKSEPGPARVVAAGRIHEQNLRGIRKRAHSGLEQRSFAEGEQPGCIS
jgi:hypothetical protein